MNAPFLDPTRVHRSLALVGDRYGLLIDGLLPTGCVGHPHDPQPVVFVADRLRADMSLVELCSAEVELQEKLGFATRILLRDELTASRGGSEILAGASPL